MTRRPKSSADAGATTEGTTAPPKTHNINPNLIAQALAELTALDLEMASIAGRKGAAINRYEAQGLDRELMRGLNALARKSQEEARAYLTGLAQYGIAAEVLPPADGDWTKSVQQSEMAFRPATGDDAEKLRMVRAHKQGFQAGKKGHSFDGSPYHGKPGSPEFVGWRNGCEEGLALRAKLKPGTENVVDASVERARRKPGNGAADEATGKDGDTGGSVH